MDMSLSKLQEMVKVREAWWARSMESQRVGHDLVTEQQLYMKYTINKNLLYSTGNYTQYLLIIYKNLKKSEKKNAHM